MRKIGYVSYVDDPTDPDPDLDVPFLVPALTEAGFQTTVIDWRAESVVSQYDALLIRSTWNYSQHIDEFLDWLSVVESQTRIINPAPVIRANLDKRYLFDLAAQGIPIIPTSLVESEHGISNIMLNEKLVFKPVIGAGARGAFATSNDQEAAKRVQDHFALSKIPLLVQPYLAEVDTLGEIAVVCSDGIPLHAITKRPALSEGGHGDFAANTIISDELAEFVSKIQEIVFAGSEISNLLYSRIDVVPTKDGFKLMELELFEPTLFLHENSNSVDVFVKNLIGHLVW